MFSLVGVEGSFLLTAKRRCAVSVHGASVNNVAAAAIVVGSGGVKREEGLPLLAPAPEKLNFLTSMILRLVHRRR